MLKFDILEKLKCPYAKDPFFLINSALIEIHLVLILVNNLSFWYKVEVTSAKKYFDVLEKLRIKIILFMLKF